MADLKKNLSLVENKDAPLFSASSGASAPSGAAVRESSKPTYQPDLNKCFGIVLSGGGARAAYQAGALKALDEYVAEKGPVSIITGSSIGAVNGIVLGGCLKLGYNQAVDKILEIWRERTYRNRTQ